MNYLQLLQDRQNFRGSAMGKDRRSMLDNPGNAYFKVFFHFNNGDDLAGSQQRTMLEANNGLLALPPADFGRISDNFFTDTYDNNANINKLRGMQSAWSYLVQNGEDERARLLEIFISELIEIMINTPWYFQKISGLDSAMERKVYEKDFKFDEQRQKITISCLADSVDERIGTLLDLYRSIIWSWKLKKEIVPANLRKFDMSIAIFEQYTDSTLETYANGSNIVNHSDPTISYKYFELHNCEIDYNSSKSGYTELDDAAGFNHTYNIDIMFDDIYEERYNQWLGVKMGDTLYGDTMRSIYKIPMAEGEHLRKQKDINKEILNYWPGREEGGFLTGMARQALGVATNMVDHFINRVKLGNIYKISPVHLIDNIKDVAEGNILNGIRNAGNIVRNYHTPHGGHNIPPSDLGHNIFEAPNQSPIDMEQVKKLGNIFKARSAVNNI